jgi:hypothetical protein
MGGLASRPPPAPLLERQDTLLSAFAGTEALELEDSFWCGSATAQQGRSSLACRDELLSFPELLTRLRPVDVELHLQPTCAMLGMAAGLRCTLSFASLTPDYAVASNGSTRHFQKLLSRTGRLLAQVCGGALHESSREASATRATNAIVLCGVIFKFAAEHLPVERMLGLLAAAEAEPGMQHARRCRLDCTSRSRVGALTSFAASVLGFLANCPLECAVCAPIRCATGA